MLVCCAQFTTVQGGSLINLIFYFLNAVIPLFLKNRALMKVWLDARSVCKYPVSRWPWDSKVWLRTTDAQSVRYHLAVGYHGDVTVWFSVHWLNWWIPIAPLQWLVPRAPLQWLVPIVPLQRLVPVAPLQRLVIDMTISCVLSALLILLQQPQRWFLL